MTVNSYFTHITGTEEQNLIEDLTIEYIQLGGMDLNYIVRDRSNEDWLYGEDEYDSEFLNKYTIEFYLESVDGFGVDIDFISGTGLEINESAKFTVSKQRFTQETTMERPKAGDLLWIPMTRSLLEIMKVKEDDPFYQKGKLYTWELTCELFDSSNDKFAEDTFTLEGEETYIPDIPTPEEEVGAPSDNVNVNEISDLFSDESNPLQGF